MALVDLVMYFGRTVANIANNVCRPDILIGRDIHFLAGTIKGKSDDIMEISFNSSDDGDRKLKEKPICCLKSLYGKFDEKSIIAIVLPLTSDSPTVKGRSIINNLAFDELYRLGAKGLLNATNISLSAPMHRGICTLVNPMTSESVRMLPTKRPITMQQIRFVRRPRCAEWCGTDPCDLMRKDTVKRPSIWLDPNCYNKLICKRILRHDIVHMPGSNKATREYQQTWIECPPIRIVPKPVCCTEPLEFPPICRRPRKVRPTTATYCQTHNVCKKKDPKCIKMEMPCCDEVRKIPCCKVFPTPACCRKRCTPFPAFSECCRPESNKKAPVECLCLARPTLCELYADWRKRYAGMSHRLLKFSPYPE